MRSVIFSQRITRSLEVIKPDLGAFDKTTCKRVLDLLQPGDLRLGAVVIELQYSQTWSEQWK